MEQMSENSSSNPLTLALILNTRWFCHLCLGTRILNVGLVPPAGGSTRLPLATAIFFRLVPGEGFGVPDSGGRVEAGALVAAGGERRAGPAAGTRAGVVHSPLVEPRCGSRLPDADEYAELPQCCLEAVCHPGAEPCCNFEQ